MSVHGKSASLEGATSKRLSIPEFAARKGAEPLVCLTAYTTPMAQRLDGHVDLLMVGDSLGMVLYGFDSTLPVTLDMMIQHGAAVCRGSRTSLVVVDMPFGSYQESPEQAFRSAARIMKETGCQAVKLEGGRDLADTVSFLVKRGVPVMGHVGLMPQSVNTLGGYRARGRGDQEAAGVMADAIAIAEAGAFSIVLEGVMEQIAQAVTARVPVPIIGIGGISSMNDVFEFLVAGASAVQIGTATFADPSVSGRLVEQLRETLLSEGLQSVRELIGTLKSNKS